VMAGLLGASVLVNLALVAVLISRDAAPNESASPIPAKRQTRTERDVTRASQEAKAIELRRAAATAERAVLAFALHNPRSKIGRKLVDARLGLLKRNAQATCRQRSGDAAPPRFVCGIRAGKVGPISYVLYRPRGAARARVTWAASAKSP
jgi:hypothetical protein